MTYNTPDWPALPPLSALTNRVHCMDALELLALLPDGSIDMVVTSPPYDNLRSYNGYSWDFEGIASGLYRALKPGGVCVWVVGDATINGSETLTSMRQALHFVDVCGFRMHDTMIWDKGTTSFPDINRYYQVWEYMFVFSKGVPKTTNLLTKPNKYAGYGITGRDRTGAGNTLKYNLNAKGREVKLEGVMSNLWQIGTGYRKTTTDEIAHQHPAIFPELLAERHILTWSDPGEIVLDPFSGSGTTAKVARNTGRRFIAGDISPEYVAIAEKRLAQPYTMPMFAAVSS